MNCLQRYSNKGKGQSFANQLPVEGQKQDVLLPHDATMFHGRQFALLGRCPDDKVL